jgi:hypothetical protein
MEDEDGIAAVGVQAAVRFIARLTGLSVAPLSSRNGSSREKV